MAPRTHAVLVDAGVDGGVVFVADEAPPEIPLLRPPGGGRMTGPAGAIVRLIRRAAAMAGRDELRDLAEGRAALRRVATLVAAGGSPGQIFKAKPVSPRLWLPQGAVEGRD